MKLMMFLRSVKTRIFLVCFVVYCAFFATNVVREHYPAFALVEHGNFRVDQYQGWHADIFVYKDGHSYINNNVATSLFAALPLFVFDPVLNALERHSKAVLAQSHGEVDTQYTTKYENRREMFRKVKLAGKDLRFGAATVITSVFLMAPLGALCVVLLYGFLRSRGIERARAVWLALLFAFGTPVFYRMAHLSQNLLLMAATFGAFLCLYEAPGQPYAPTLRRRLGAGLLLGTAFALDYAGLIPPTVVAVYFLWNRTRAAGPLSALRSSLAILVGGVPGLGFLLWSQWSQFGSPFTPAQFVMKAANFTDQGVRGMGAPSVEIFIKNLVSPGWGLYTFGPILLLGLWPVGGRPDAELVVPHRERRMFVVLIALFLLFCAGNRYSLMQFNTGCRYLVVLVPFIFLQACDQLAHYKPRVLMLLSVLAVAHSLVLCMTREVNDTEKNLRDTAQAQHISELALPGYWRAELTETPIPVAYQRIVHEGVQLPWLTVLGQTAQTPLVKGPLLPSVLLLLVLAACVGIWQLGARAERRPPPA